VIKFRIQFTILKMCMLMCFVCAEFIAAHNITLATEIFRLKIYDVVKIELYTNALNIPILLTNIETHFSHSVVVYFNKSKWLSKFHYSVVNYSGAINTKLNSRHYKQPYTLLAGRRSRKNRTRLRAH